MSTKPGAVRSIHARAGHQNNPIETLEEAVLLPELTSAET